jgi:predicted O-methyltransferase YrrM
VIPYVLITNRERASVEEIFITNPKIENYLSSLLPSSDETLVEMEKLSEETGFPIVGPLVGRFLYLIALAKGAKRVFELGSGFGYSAYWLAKAIGKEGIIYLTEKSETNVALAREFLLRGGLMDRAKIICGDGLEALENTEGNFDIIFNDIDKEDYPKVVGTAYEKLKRGGLFITDNLLWHGKVASEDESPSTRGVREFTSSLLSHEGFFTTIIPIRDGISISIKL